MKGIVQRKGLSAALIGAVMTSVIMLGAGPASASAASQAFTNCMSGYQKGQQAALLANKDILANAILSTGFARCYYDLSQRNDISSETEIQAIRNFNSNLATAKIYIAKAGVKAYEEWLKKYGLRGLSGL